MIHTIRVQTTKGPDLKGEGVLGEIHHLLRMPEVKKVQTVKVYRLEGIGKQEAKKLAEIALMEAVNQKYSIDEPLLDGTKHIIEIAYKPGVMNPEVGSILKTARDLGITLSAADSSFEYAFYGKLTEDDIATIIKKLNLLNQTVEHLVTKAPHSLLIAGTVGEVTTVPLRKLTRSKLEKLSKDRQLFLDGAEMEVIQAHFTKLKRDPTDCELEILAQTWSEHCVHKTFKADLTIDGKKKPSLYSRIKDTARGHDDLIISAFVDNSGVIDFFDGYAICGKVETHNSPSAIEPYGGAMTGSGGVFRDVLGTGQGARVLVSTDIFCFAPPNLPEKELPPGALPPQYILKKVVAGVRDYGNRVGIPTNNGSLHFHKDFRAKPTVAVGAYGLIEKKKAKKQTPKVGDLIITIGGRTGRDGIHGATFSSGEMTGSTGETAGSAVQIGNAIEEKRMIDAILEMSKQNLIRSLTDCGAGGYSSAVGEMGEKTGVTVHLEKVPLKYASLSPWEIFLSESQERMVLAIDPQKKQEVMKISKRFNVESTEIGTFDGSKRLRVLYKDRIVCDLDMAFAHDGLPKRHMIGISKKLSLKQKIPTEPKAYEEVWKKVMAHGNVCSKEPIVRLYDHNVMGATALHPFSGVYFDGPNDGSIIKPFLDKPYGLAVTHGLNPTLNNIDPYNGSIWAIAEAVSNFVAIGGNLQNAALIDNFIWPFPDAESLADLDKSVDACSQMARLLRMPFVSGKDSLSSTYRYKDGKALKIPPVLLISVFGKIADVRRTMSTDFKKQGSLIVLVGKPDLKNLGGSTYFDITNSSGSTVPTIDQKSLIKTLDTITKAIQEKLVLAIHDISEGGIAAAVAEMSFGAGFGATLDLKKIAVTRPDFTLFNETAGTFLVEVKDEATAAKAFKNVPYQIIGRTVQGDRITIHFGKKQIADMPLQTLRAAWQKPMKEMFS